MTKFLVTLLFGCVMGLAGCSPRIPPSSREIEAFTQECDSIHERCEVVKGRIKAVDDRIVIGEATVSYYAGFFEGRPMANGEPFSNQSVSVAHRSLPFNSIVYFSSADCQLSSRRLSTMGAGGRQSVPGPDTAPTIVYSKSACGIVRDRGPFHRDSQGRYDREYDLSQAMFSRLAPLDKGLATVEYGVILPVNQVKE